MEELCEKYNMVQRQQPAILYDVFLFNDELDMLEVILLCSQCIYTRSLGSLFVHHS